MYAWPGAQRAEHGRAVRVDVARERLGHEQVRAQVAERALVGHQPQRHAAANADADLVGVDATERDATAPRAQAVPLVEVAPRRMVEEPAGRGDEREQLADAVDAFGGVGHEAPQLDARVALGVEVAPRHPRAAALEALGSLRERVREKAEATSGLDARDDLRRRQVAVVDGLAQAEREVVVLAPRRDLEARQEQRGAVPTLLAVIGGGERVVVCEQQVVEAGRPGGRCDLRHRAGAVRVGGVAVDHSREVVRQGGAAMPVSVSGLRCLAHERGGHLMATVEAPETLGIRPFDEFDGVYDIWPRGDRPDAIRDAARRFRAAVCDRREPGARREDRRPGVGRLSRRRSPSTARPRRSIPTSTSSTAS